MSLIAMAVFCTDENKKDECLKIVVDQLYDTLTYLGNRIFFCVNGATERTKEILRHFKWRVDDQDNGYEVHIIYNDENIGTARAINKAWAQRLPGEHCIKMDDDIFIEKEMMWVDRLDEAITRDPLIGQCALKRNDCWEYPGNPSPDHNSELKMLPHVAGEPWIVVEKVKHVIGSCVMHSSALLDKVGGLYQPSLYGYDDVIMSHRSYLAGFYSCFLPHIRIHHIDEGKTPYQDWKHKHSGEQTDKVIELVHAMIRKEKSIYYPFE